LETKVDFRCLQLFRRFPALASLSVCPDGQGENEAFDYLWDGGPEWELPELILDCSVDDAIEWMNSGAFPSKISKFRWSGGGGVQGSITIYHDLPSACPNLQELKISWNYTFEWCPLTVSYLQPLATYANLEVLEVSHLGVPEVNTSELQSLASHWPRLKILRLTDVTSNQDGTLSVLAHLDLDIIPELATSCPHLEEVHIHVDTLARVSDWRDVKKLKHLRVLDVVNSPCLFRVDVETLAAILHRRLSFDTQLVFARRPTKDIPAYIKSYDWEGHFERWEKTKELLRSSGPLDGFVGECLHRARWHRALPTYVIPSPLRRISTYTRGRRDLAK
jgi:hypothetical protein